MASRNHRSKPAARRSAKRSTRPAEAAGRDWLYGRHAVLAALANPARQCIRLLLTAEAARTLARPADAEPAPEIVDRAAIDRLLPGAVHQGFALSAAPLPPPALEQAARPVPGRRNLVVVLDQVTDPHNVGAILRSAAAFAVRAVLVTERHAPAASGVLAKAASGALETMPLVPVVNLARTLDALAELDYWLVGLDAGAEAALDAAVKFDNLALVLGAEGKGLRRLTAERCDLLARIDLPGEMASLNVSNAAAVALYALTQASRPED